MKSLTAYLFKELGLYLLVREEQPFQIAVNSPFGILYSSQDEFTCIIHETGIVLSRLMNFETNAINLPVLIKSFF
jgi:hypothetical protein